MDEDCRHAERIGDEAGMLSASPAEAVERIARHVVPALHGDLLDRVRHVFDGDRDEAVGDRFRTPASADLGRHRDESSAHGIGIEGLVPAGPEDRREEIGLKLADHDIRIRHGERPAVAIGLRSRIGAGAVGPAAEALTVEMQDRATTRRHRMDQHHRRAHADARDLRLEGTLVGAVEMGDVGRGAAHVEADHLREAGREARLGHADHATGGAGEDRILALEQLCRREAARRHHEHQPRAGALDIELLRHLPDIAAQDRREIGVDNRRVAASHELDQRRHLMADRDLREAHGAGDRCCPLLVIGEAPGMHEDNGDSLEAPGLEPLERSTELRLVQRLLHGAVGENPLADFRDLGVEELGLDDGLGEDLRPRLVADLQRIAEAARRHQRGRVTLALEERVGGYRRAHAHFTDQTGRDRRA